MTILAAIGMCALLVLTILAYTATVGAWQRARIPCHCGHCDRCKPWEK